MPTGGFVENAYTILVGTVRYFGVTKEGFAGGAD